MGTAGPPALAAGAAAELAPGAAALDEGEAGADAEAAAAGADAAGWASAPFEAFAAPPPLCAIAGTEAPTATRIARPNACRRMILDAPSRATPPEDAACREAGKSHPRPGRCASLPPKVARPQGKEANSEGRTAVTDSCRLVWRSRSFVGRGRTPREGARQSSGGEPSLATTALPPACCAESQPPAPSPRRIGGTEATSRPHLPSTDRSALRRCGGPRPQIDRARRSSDRPRT